MLGKLLKYEIPAMGRRLGPLFAAWAAASVFLGLALRTVQSHTELLMILSVLIYVGVGMALFVMMFVLIIQRYSRSLLGDEAYFNLTLPVTAAEHIANKTISAMIWTAITSFAALVSIFLIALFGAGIREIMNFDWQLWWIDLADAATWQGILFIIEMIILFILSTVKSILGIYAAITIGHQAKDRTTLLSIAAYIGLMAAESTIGKIAMNLGVFSGFDKLYSYKWFPASQGLALSATLITLVIAGAYFYICKYLIENKLNLN